VCSVAVALLGGLLRLGWGPNLPGLQTEVGVPPPNSVPSPPSLSPAVLADKMEVNGKAARGVRWYHSRVNGPL
jgi:hypothetical protein